MDFVGGSFVQVTSFDLRECEYCPWSLQSALGRRLQAADCAVDALAVRPFLPFWRILLEETFDDGADCWAIIVDSFEIAEAVLGTAVEAVAVELAGDGTSDNFRAFDSCSACFDSPECCLRSRLHERCSASMAPSFAAVDSSSSCVAIDSRA